MVSALIGLRLCGIALEPLLHLADFGALQVTQFDGDHLHRRPHRRAGPQVFGVTVAGDHLGGRDWREAEAFTDERLDRRVDVRVRAYCAAELAHRDRLAGGTQPLTVAVDLQCPQCDLGAERRRLGVDAVSAPDHHRVAVGAGQFDDGGQQRRRGFDQQVCGVTQRPTPRRVDDVARRQAVVHPCA
jgi:hypothetical protein